MDLSHIKGLIEAMAATDLAEMSYSRDGWTLKLQRFAAASSSAPTVGAAPVAEARAPAATETAAMAATPIAIAPAVAVAPTASATVDAPMYGIVHLQPSPGAAPFVSVGDAVAAGQTLCVIEAMKVFNAVQAEAAGVIEAVLVPSGEEVDVGQTLFRLASR